MYVCLRVSMRYKINIDNQFMFLHKVRRLLSLINIYITLFLFIDIFFIAIIYQYQFIQIYLSVPNSIEMTTNECPHHYLSR